MTHEVRPLTQEEVDAFADYPNFANVAMLSSDGIWYYAESDFRYGDAGEYEDMTMFVTDEDGDYIPVKTK
jgi:hypothetical protein